VEGALLRLRPKVMTVSTVVAGLLPIMWSTRVGAEVMKPLATPVLGGMISSLVHVLIVTPVIFFWLQERRLGLQHQPLPASPRHAVRWRPVLMALGLTVLLVATLVMWRGYRGNGDRSRAADGSATVVQRVQSGGLQIVLMSPTGTFRLGRNTFAIEFRSAAGALVDVGKVSASANMAMPGMVMSSGLQLTPSDVPGRYQATAEFGMAGAWPMALQWDGPAGRGSVNFEGMVQ
jgi:AcrB/AcrD/AcrF family/YtkA-like